MVVNFKNTLVSDKPRTTLGKRLKEIRARIIDSGEKLLDWDDLEIELLERKGEKILKKLIFVDSGILIAASRGNSEMSQ